MANSGSGSADKPNPNLIADPLTPRGIGFASNTTFEPPHRPSKEADTATGLLATYNRGPDDEDLTQRDRTLSQTRAQSPTTPGVDTSGSSAFGEKITEQLESKPRSLRAFVAHDSFGSCPDSLIGEGIDYVGAEPRHSWATIGSS